MDTTNGNGHALAVIDFAPDKIELLKRTICRGSTDDELDLFIYACKRTGLDPFMRQIHAVKRWDNKANRETMTIQTAIDGYRLIADRTGQYAGNDDPHFSGEIPENNWTHPAEARVTVYKMVQNQRCPFSATARWAEYYPGEKGGFMWRKMPHVMLGKVAEALALRKAFPAELSGVYTREEMDQAGPVVDVDTPPVQPTRQQDEQPAVGDVMIALDEAFNVAKWPDDPEKNRENYLKAVVAKVSRRLKRKLSTVEQLPLDDQKKLIESIKSGAVKPDTFADKSAKVIEAA